MPTFGNAEFGNDKANDLPQPEENKTLQNNPVDFENELQTETEQTTAELDLTQNEETKSESFLPFEKYIEDDSEIEYVLERDNKNTLQSTDNEPLLKQDELSDIPAPADWVSDTPPEPPNDGIDYYKEPSSSFSLETPLEEEMTDSVNTAERSMPDDNLASTHELPASDPEIEVDKDDLALPKDYMSTASYDSAPPKDYMPSNNDDMLDATFTPLDKNHIDGPDIEEPQDSGLSFESLDSDDAFEKFKNDALEAFEKSIVDETEPTTTGNDDTLKESNTKPSQPAQAKPKIRWRVKP